MSETEAIVRFRQALAVYDEVRAGAREIGLSVVPGTDLLRGAACLMEAGSTDTITGATTDLTMLDGEEGEAAAQVMALLVQAAVELVEAATTLTSTRTKVFRG